MKNIYLIKSDNDWKQLNQSEFTEFLRSSDADGRFFARIPKDIGKEGPNVIYEVDEVRYAEWRVEKRHFQYLRDNRRNSGFNIVSYEDSDLVNRLLTDKDELLEIVLKSIYKRTLIKALKELEEEEYTLIANLFFSEDKKTEKIIAGKLGVSQQMISKRKKQILEKLKNILNSWL